MNAVSRVLVGLCLILVPALAGAQAKFGAEFNFMNLELREAQTDRSQVNPATAAARDQLLQKVLKICGGCKSETIRAGFQVSHKIIYPDGWYFVISTDPSVVEIQTKPSTTAEIKAHLDIIQKHIFDAAVSIGLKPATQVVSKMWAMSHIHVGLQSSLGEGPEALRMLRNMMVDFSNHAELAYGVFTRDVKNAPPLAALPEESQQNFRDIIAAVDRGEITTVKEFADAIRAKVYHNSLNEGTAKPGKYQAFNIQRIGSLSYFIDQQTFEIRSMRGQESAQDYLDQTRLIEARLNYLKTQTTVKVELPNLQKLGEARQAERFYDYVTETGLSFEPYEKYLSEKQVAYLMKKKGKSYSSVRCEMVL